MKFRITACIIVAISVLSVSQQLNATDSNSFSSPAARANGLTIQWVTQAEIDAGAEIIQDVDLYVSNTKSTVYYELIYNGAREQFSQYDRGPDGKVMGIEEAERWANLRMEIVQKEVEARGGKFDGRVVRYAVPQTTIFVLTEHGDVQAIDAETGKTKWSTEVGNHRFPSIDITGDDLHVVVANGSRIYLLEAETGKHVWDRKCRSLPTGVSLSEKFIYVSEINGMVEAYPFEGSGFGPNMYVSVGSVKEPVTVSPSTVSWPTDKGYYYVGALDKAPNLRFRLKTHDAIRPGTWLDDHLFVGSTDGILYALDELHGSILWEFSTGEEIRQQPVLINGDVFLTTINSHLYKIDARTGLPDPNWPSRIKDIRHFVAATKNRVYAVDVLGHLVTVNRQSGSRISEMHLPEGVTPLPNMRNDRLYFSTNRGAIACLREIGLDRPLFHPLSIGEESAMPKLETILGTPAKDPFTGEGEAAMDPNDPFNTNRNEGKKTENTDKNDPFNTNPAADPGKKDPDDDPNADPFGGG